MDEETRKRLWAAGTYAGMTPPKLAKALGTSVDTLKRRVSGKKEWRAFEDEEALLRRVAELCGLPYEFFLVDFDDLPTLWMRSQPMPEPTPLSAAEDQRQLERTVQRLREAVDEATRQLQAARGAEAPGREPPESDDQANQSEVGRLRAQ